MNVDTKKLTLIIALAAVTVALNPVFTGIAIPAPYAPFLYYQIWEIPIVTAFALINLRSAVAIAFMNMTILIVVFPGALITGPFYNLLAVLSMLLGIYVSYRLLTLKNNSIKTPNATLKKQTIQIATATILGVALRTGLMAIVNYAVLRYEPPIGYAMPETAILAATPLIALFNSTLALYTVPIGHIVANAVKKNLKL
ncbi:MAG: hypothetical protein N3D85_04210 [Candidatus Bathyarchaeota archaeon]|nr:hypothetical protein [Candidatus Bathyarchaeota archaeon]